VRPAHKEGVAEAAVRASRVKGFGSILGIQVRVSTHKEMRVGSDRESGRV